MKRKISAVLLILIMVINCVPFSAFAESDMPDDAEEYNGHYYKVYVDDEITWRDAKVECEELGGHLATITDEEENEFVYDLVRDAQLTCWLGATDEDEEGVWQWVTDEEWDYSNGEFDNTSDLQHYLTINHVNDGIWDDQSERDAELSNYLCKTGGYVCEWDPVETDDTDNVADVESESVEEDTSDDNENENDSDGGFLAVINEFMIPIIIVSSALILLIVLLVIIVVVNSKKKNDAVSCADICPNCGAEVSKETKFCGKCGGKLR